jgi:hypothetical protein
LRGLNLRAGAEITGRRIHVAFSLIKSNFLLLSLIFLIVSLIFLFCCQPKGELISEEEELEPQAVQEETEETKTPPAPRMTEELYIDLTARSALIWDKYKDEPEKAQQEVDNLYLRAGVTWKEYKEFEAKLTPQQRDALQKKILDYMQKIIHEYR